MSIDLCIRIDRPESLPGFAAMAKTLGFAGLATSLDLGSPSIVAENGIVVYRRAELNGRSLSTMKHQVAQVRRQSAVVAVPLRGADVINWAAEDPRVDLITVIDDNRDNMLRESTAKLAAKHDVALEIKVSGLLETSGLDRSRIIKTFRENVTTAVHAGQHVVLSSDASDPLGMRSPTAMQWIGNLLGLEGAHMKDLVETTSADIVARNIRKMASSVPGSGIEIVREGGRVE